MSLNPSVVIEPLQLKLQHLQKLKFGAQLLVETIVSQRIKIFYLLIFEIMSC